MAEYLVVSDLIIFKVLQDKDSWAISFIEGLTTMAHFLK